MATEQVWSRFHLTIVDQPTIDFSPLHNACIVSENRFIVRAAGIGAAEVLSQMKASQVDHVRGAHESPSRPRSVKSGLLS